MIALKILDIKKLIAALLVTDTFDDYSLLEAQITTFCTFSIDGRFESDFFEDENEDGRPDTGSDRLVPWKLVRERCFDLIKGKRTPLAFRFVLFYPPALLPGFLGREDVTVRPDNVLGLCVNLRFDGTNLLVTTGTSMKSFTADRSLDQAWDKEILRLINSLNVETEQL